MIRKILFYILLLAVGVGIGIYYFGDVKPREFLKLQDCNPCITTNELLGLLTSVGLKTGAEGYVVDKIHETDKTIAIKHPTSKEINHFVILPKKDIKNIADVGEEDKLYILDAVAVAQRIIHDKNLTKYQLVTNGPGYQDVTYLHFHLVGE